MPNLDNLNTLIERAISDIEHEPIGKPAKRWRNWWRLKRGNGTYCIRCGTPLRHGQESGPFPSHCTTHPSKDIAETKGREFEATHSHIEFIEARED
jgi:hypothetical protein